ncbi:hypothetical protein LTR28_012879, partial [Elasticomyces elasticus]
MAVNNLDALTNENVAEDRKEREDGREGCLAIDDHERHVVDFQAVGEVANARSAGVGMGDDDDLVATIDEFLAHQSVAEQRIIETAGPSFSTQGLLGSSVVDSMAPLYARYIPPKTKPVDHAPAPPQAGSEPAEETTIKTKLQRNGERENTTKRRRSHEEEATRKKKKIRKSEQDRDAQNADEKKEKVKKVKKEKHTAVLSKFEKATGRAQEQISTADQPADQAVGAEAAVLH